MNYRQLVKKIQDTGKVVWIDGDKGKRGLNEIRVFRFFFCNGEKQELNRLVEKNNAIGFYLIIERLYFKGEYEVCIKLIDKKQMNYESIFFESYKQATPLYKVALDKIQEILK